MKVFELVLTQVIALELADVKIQYQFDYHEVHAPDPVWTIHVMLQKLSEISFYTL